MGAKYKLNSAYLNGAIVVAGLAGLVTGSPAVFVVGLALLVGSSIWAGEIRGSGGGQIGKRPPDSRNIRS